MEIRTKIIQVPSLKFAIRRFSCMMVGTPASGLPPAISRGWSKMKDITIRRHRPGDASCVSWLHMKLYRETYGFKGIFEHYVMQALAEFLLDDRGGALWVAERDGRIIGSIGAVPTAGDEIQLRWFVIETDCQGGGIGTALFRTALDFCRERGYRHAYLWTVSTLSAARHLYRKFGFRPTEEKPNDLWTNGTLTEERWDAEL